MADSIDLDTKVTYVLKQPVFTKLTSEEIDQLAQLFVEKTFKENETIVTEGDLVDSIYIILSGKADVRHITIKDGQAVTTSLATLGVGHAIGLNETGFYSLSGVRTATVVALTEMSTLFLSLPRFHGFALAFPHVNEIMHKNSEKIFEDIAKTSDSN